MVSAFASHIQLNSSFINPEKRFMFVEIRSVEETCTLLQLDGICYVSVLASLCRDNTT